MHFVLYYVAVQYSMEWSSAGSGTMTIVLSRQQALAALQTSTTRQPVTPAPRFFKFSRRQWSTAHPRRTLRGPATATRRCRRQ